MGSPALVATAQLVCPFGAAPAVLNVLPANRVMIEGRPAATVADMVPFLNVAPFGMCMSLSNPTVASATAMALGVLVPMPCVPVTTGTWAPGAAKTTIGGLPVATQGNVCTCAYGGVIQVVMAGSLTTMVG